MTDLNDEDLRTLAVYYATIAKRTRTLATEEERAKQLNQVLDARRSWPEDVWKRFVGMIHKESRDYSKTPFWSRPAAVNTEFGLRG